VAPLLRKEFDGISPGSDFIQGFFRIKTSLNRGSAYQAFLKVVGLLCGRGGLSRSVWRGNLRLIFSNRRGIEKLGEGGRRLNSFAS
jgi:hypothetical protein